VNGEHWCKDCLKITKKEPYLEKAKNFAISKGGECLAIEYKNRDEKLAWKCDNKNHKSWLSSYRSVMSRGFWCPQCRKEI